MYITRSKISWIIWLNCNCFDNELMYFRWFGFVCMMVAWIRCTEWLIRKKEKWERTNGNREFNSIGQLVIRSLNVINTHRFADKTMRESGRWCSWNGWNGWCCGCLRRRYVLWCICTSTVRCFVWCCTVSLLQSTRIITSVQPYVSYVYY